MMNWQFSSVGSLILSISIEYKIPQKRIQKQQQHKIETEKVVIAKKYIYRHS